MIGEWLDHVLNKYEKKKSCEVVMVCWAIWGPKNKLVWEQRNPMVQQIILTTQTFFEQLSKAQNKYDVSMKSFIPGDDLDKWVKPTEEMSSQYICCVVC